MSSTALDIQEPQSRGPMTNAQTEARAIVFGYGIGEPFYDMIVDRIATALAAKDAELAEIRQEYREFGVEVAERENDFARKIGDETARAERAEIQLEASAKVALELSNKLAEANKTLARLEEWAERAAFPTIADIARRAREQRGE